MHAIRLVEPRQPLQLLDLPDPTPAAGEIVVDIQRAGICHTDAHYRAGTATMSLPVTRPVTLGHEIAGVVSAVSGGVTDVREGERGALHYLTSCASASAVAADEQFCPTGGMLARHSPLGSHRRSSP